MNRILLSSLGISLFAALVTGCMDQPTGVGDSGSVDESRAGAAQQSREFAVQVAQAEVARMAEVSGSDEWTAESRVTEAFPLYLEGVDGVSYYECKVTTGSTDAGYVLVNVNKTDILVPELQTSGTTLNEYYRAHLNRTDVSVVRYDWFISAAYQGTTDPNVSRGSMLATLGAGSPTSGLGKETAANDVIAYLQNVTRSKGCFPQYTREQLARCYEHYADTSRSGAAKIAADWRNYYAELSYGFANGWHTPAWTQFSKDNGYPIGCGPTAWAIVYGYWCQFRGKTGLFNPSDLSDRYQTGHTWDTDVMACMSTVAGYVATEDVTGKRLASGAKAGLTWPWNMAKGIQYAADKGYSGNCVRHWGISEYSRFDIVYNDLRNNRPAVLLIAADGGGIVDHYVVAEAANKSQIKYAWNWHNRDVKYLVNYGWGGGTPRKWICTQDWGWDQNEEYPCYSNYSITIN